MKAKSKVLLGLIVALAMMVFAVPALAATTFTISGPTPEKPVAYAGETPTDATFTFTVSDSSGKSTDTYKVDVADTATSNKVNITTDATAFTGTEKTVKVTVTADKNSIGAHTLRATVTKETGDNTGTDTKDFAITVAELPTATLSGADTSPKEVYVGYDVGLSVPSYTPADVPADKVKYEWQKTDAKADAPNTPDDTKWAAIPGEDQPVFVGKATADLDGKFVRCAVTIDGKTVIAKQGTIENVKLKVTDYSKITLNLYEGTEGTTAAKANYEYFVGATPTVLRAVVTDYPFSITYTWTKDGKEIPATVATVGENGTLTFLNATEDTAGTYECVASSGDIKSDPKTVTIAINKTPTLKINEADGDASKYNNLEPVNTTNAKIYLTKDQIGKALSLSIDAENYEWIKWSKATGEIPGAANSKTYNVEAADVTKGAAFTAQVKYKGITKPLAYTATITETGGTLSGGTTISEDGKTFKTAPDYTITLPEGYDFGTVATGTFTLTQLEDAGVTFDNTLPEDDTKVQVKEVTKYNSTTKAPATARFQFTETDTDSPIVEPLKIVVRANVGTETTDVTLPVSDENKVQITLPIKSSDLILAGPADSYSQDKKTANVKYTGEPVAEKAQANDDIDGVGEISNYRYEAFTETEPQKPSAKATTEAPTDAGNYAVFCDVANGTKYSGAKDLKAGVLKIEQVKLSTNDAKANEKYIVIEPKENVYNGKVQKPEVKFADDVKKAGAIDKVTFKQGKQEAVTLKVGKYDVYVTTKEDGTTPAAQQNIALTETAVPVGTYEITKTQPTADLYKLDPAEVKYDGEEHTANVVKVNDEAGSVKDVHYFKDGSEEELEGKPVEAGKYTVKICTYESNTYAAADEEHMLNLGTFTIKEDKADQQDIYMIGHVQNIGWGEDEDKDNKGDGKAVKLESGKTAQVGTTGLSLRVEAVTILVPEDYTVEGFAHVQDIGDKNVEALDSIPSYITNKSDIPEGYKAYMFGTQGQSKRVEAVNIGIKDADGKYVEGFEYATHVQNQGWLGSVRNGSFSGSRGQSLRMEAIRFYYDDQVRKPTDIDAETK